MYKKTNFEKTIKIYSILVFMFEVLRFISESEYNSLYDIKQTAQNSRVKTKHVKFRDMDIDIPF